MPKIFLILLLLSVTFNLPTKSTSIGKNLADIPSKEKSLETKSAKDPTAILNIKQKLFPIKFLAQLNLLRKYPKAFGKMIHKKFMNAESQKSTIINGVKRKIVLD